jgi:hypothetical protein
MPLNQIAETMQKGMGGTLGFLAIVVALHARFHHQKKQQQDRACCGQNKCCGIHL